MDILRSIFLGGLTSILAPSAFAENLPAGSNATFLPVSDFPQSLQRRLLQSFSTSSVISITDSDFSGFGTITDCETGWASDIWELTITGVGNGSTKLVTFTISDDFIVGDYFEFYVNGKLYDTTPQVPLFGGTYSVGKYSISLGSGTHQFKIRDAAYDDFDPATLSFMCPAGFNFSWSIGPTTSPVFRGVTAFFGAAAKQIGLTAGEIIAEFRGLGPAWDAIMASWTLKKGADFHDLMTDSDLRAMAIDEAYNSPSASVVWKGKVDLGVSLYCPSCSSWNDLTPSQMRDDELWTYVCTSVGGGYCSGWILPQGAKKILLD